MTLFNRIVVTLMLLAMIPIITVGLIVPREAIQFLADGLDQIETRLDPSVSGVWLLVRVGLALLVDGLLVVLLYLQVRRPAAYGVPVQQVEGGEARIAVSSIEEQLEYHIDPLPGVLHVKPTVIPRRRGVEVALEIEVVADLNLPANIEDISTVARRVVEHGLGLRLKGKPKLNLRTVPYPEPETSPEIQHPAFAVRDDEPSAEEPARLGDEEPALPGVGERAQS